VEAVRDEILTRELTQRLAKYALNLKRALDFERSRLGRRNAFKIYEDHAFTEMYYFIGARRSLLQKRKKNY